LLGNSLEELTAPDNQGQERGWRCRQVFLQEDGPVVNKSFDGTLPCRH
jgi:hypothetical protein